MVSGISDQDTEMFHGKHHIEQIDFLLGRMTQKVAGLQNAPVFLGEQLMQATTVILNLCKSAEILSRIEDFNE